MKAVLITLTVGILTLLLSGCPDLPAGPGAAQSDTHWTASRLKHAPHESAAQPSGHSTSQGDVRHSVSEIAWFQGTIDEAFSRRGCSELHPRRTLFRF